MESWLKIICILSRYRKQIHDIYERKQRLPWKYKKEDVVEPLIRVQNLMKIYNPGENEVRALDDVSLDIGRGEFVASSGSRAPENPPL